MGWDPGPKIACKVEGVSWFGEVRKREPVSVHLLSGTVNTHWVSSTTS
jgi:hypothetical protein